MTIEQNRRFSYQASIEQSLKEIHLKITDLENSFVTLTARVQNCEQNDHRCDTDLQQLYRYMATMQTELGRLSTELGTLLHTTNKFAKNDDKDCYRLEAIVGMTTNIDKTLLPQDREEIAQYYRDHADQNEATQIANMLNGQYRSPEEVAKFRAYFENKKIDNEAEK